MLRSETQFVIAGIVSLIGQTLGGRTACHRAYRIPRSYFMARSAMLPESTTNFTGLRDRFALSKRFVALHGTNPHDNGLFTGIGGFVPQTNSSQTRVTPRNKSVQLIAFLFAPTAR
jgi:hypothetical protein